MRPIAMRQTSVSTAVVIVLFLAACQGNATTSDAISSGDGGAATVAVAAASPNPTGGGETPGRDGEDPGRGDQAVAGASEALYDPWARVLTEYVDEEGLVDYAGLAADGRDDLEAFMRTIGSTDPSRFSEAEQIAFWINAYNATTIYQVVQRYPLESVRDVGTLFGLVGGFFKQKYRVANEERSVDNIEHDILRPTYNDARIHWTLVCASFGCPRLLRRPYTAADLDPLLTEVSFEFMASPRALHIDDDDDTLWVTSYFDWYGDDFEAAAGDIVDYILRYAPEDKATWIREHRDTMRVRFMDYDWTLNDQSKGPRSRRPVEPS